MYVKSQEGGRVREMVTYIEQARVDMYIKV